MSQHTCPPTVLLHNHKCTGDPSYTLPPAFIPPTFPPNARRCLSTGTPARSSTISCSCRNGQSPSALSVWVPVGLRNRSRFADDINNKQKARGEVRRGVWRERQSTCQCLPARLTSSLSVSTPPPPPPQCTCRVRCLFPHASPPALSSIAIDRMRRSHAAAAPADVYACLPLWEKGGRVRGCGGDQRYQWPTPSRGSTQPPSNKQWRHPTTECGEQHMPA